MRLCSRLSDRYVIWSWTLCSGQQTEFGIEVPTVAEGRSSLTREWVLALAEGRMKPDEASRRI